MSETSDFRDRRTARSSLDSNVVVEAGAGTGKTALLTDRILFLLLGFRRAPAAAIGEIAALTFTEKAAGEIKVRLTERLSGLVTELSGGALAERERVRAQELLRELRETGQAFKAGEAEILARARAALEDMDKAAIGTIHSFAARVLRAYPVEARVDPGFSVDEGAAFDELFETEWSRWLDAELGQDPPRAQEWLEALSLCPLEDLEGLARELCRERLGLDGVAGPDPQTAARLEDLAAGLARIPCGRPAPHPRSNILKSIDEASRHLATLAAAARAEFVALPKALARARFKKSAWPSAWEGPGHEDYKRIVDAANASSPGEEALLRRACRLLTPFARAFRETFAKRGLVSFDGLLLKARDLVRDHPQVREELKNRWSAILVDEFQDTDPLQGELLIFLAEERGASARRWQDVRPAPGKLFVVGDPKQSIYRFRGADIAAYQGFARKILEGPKALACDLKANFRSPEGVLGPVNAVFARLMRPAPGLQPEYKALESAAAGREGAIEFVTIDPPEAAGRPYDAETSRARQAEWIARWISENCGPGRSRRYKDVAVLMRSAGAVGAILDAFKGAGVPYAVEAEKSFYASQEVLDFLNLLRALDDPEDRLALAGLLRSPLVGLGDPALYRLCLAQGLNYFREPPTEFAGEDRERLERFFALLRSLRERVGRAPLDELVRAALDQTCLLELSARAYHGEQSAANILKLARLASEGSRERGLTLREFIERAAQDREGARDEGESPLADEFLEAVRVMTIHKSKGLEFPVVFLVDATGGVAARRKAASLLDWGFPRPGLRLAHSGAADAAMAWLEYRERIRQDHEAARLLYVALTRAKERLFVLGRREAESGSLAGLLSSVGAWPAAEGAEIGIESLSWRLKVNRARADEAILKGKAPARPARGPRPGPEARSLAALWGKRARLCGEVSKLKWTRSPTDELKEPAKRFLPEEAEPASASAGSLVGRLCHRVLEGWNFRGGGDLRKAAAAACRVLAWTEPSADWEAARAQAEEILGTFLSSGTARELGHAEILGREVPFAYEENGAVMRGTIDLLYRQGGKIIVAD